MAIYLELEYGGEIVASAPIEITENGHMVKALISARTSSLQVGHIWFPSQFGNAGRGQSSINAEVDQTLRVLFRADTVEDLEQFRDFVQLRTAVVMWMFSDDSAVAGSGGLISFAEFEVPHTGLFVAHAVLEVPEPLRLLVSQAELEVVETGVFISQAELEVVETGLFVSLAELQVPTGDVLGQEDGAAVLQEDGGEIKLED